MLREEKVYHAHMYIQETKSKLPHIIQQPIAIHADPEPASIQDIYAAKKAKQYCHT